MGRIADTVLKPLQLDYLTKPIPAGQRNVSAAYFNLQEVKDLVNALSNTTLFVKVFLVLEDDPATPNQKRVSMGMTGGDSNGVKVFTDLTGDGIPNEGLLADRPCPPDCHGDDGNLRYVVGN